MMRLFWLLVLYFGVIFYFHSRALSNDTCCQQCRNAYNVSCQARNVLLEELQSLVVALSKTPKEISENIDERDKYIVACVKEWKHGIIKLGYSYDIFIRDGQDRLPYTIISLSGGDELSEGEVLGKKMGGKLCDAWKMKIVADANERYDNDHKRRKRTRAEIISENPRVEAAIYLSKLLCACPRPLSDAKNVGSEPENGKN